jgi:hypothetical protein
MNCPYRSEQDFGTLLDYMSGRLDSARTQTLETHMLVCADCAAFKTEQAEVWAALDLWEAPPVSLSFNREVLHTIEVEASAPWYRKLADSFRMGVWKPAFPLAAAVVVIAAGFLFDHQSVGTGTASPGISNAAGVSITEVDQVERTLDDIQLLRQFDTAANASRPL